MKYARIENGVVVEMVGNDPFALFQPSHAETFIECNDSVQYGWVSNGDGTFSAPVPHLPTSITEYQEAVQARLDGKAQERGYDGILSLCTYANSSVPQFAAEGKAGEAWRDAAWGECYAILAAVQAGQRPQPSIDELLAELPVMAWPA